MNTNPDDWWLRRRHPPVGPGDAWSGGGEAYRAWMGAKPRRGRSAASTGLDGAPHQRTADRRGPPLRSVAGHLLSVVSGLPWIRVRDRARFRTLVGLGAVGLAAVVFLVPLAWAGRMDPCAAAEVALVDKAIGLDGRFSADKVRVANWTGADGRLLSHGRVGREIAAKEYAGWPPAAGCTALFWRARWEVASFGGFTPVLARAWSARR